MKTIAQQINWDFEANDSLVIRNKNGKLIYFENSAEFWAKYEYDSEGNEIYYINSDGFWTKYEYDSKGKRIYIATSDGFWSKREYDFQGNEIYYENSHGTIVDNRHKPSDDKVVEIETIEIDGVKYKLTKP